MIKSNRLRLRRRICRTRRQEQSLSISLATSLLLLAALILVLTHLSFAHVRVSKATLKTKRSVEQNSSSSSNRDNHDNNYSYVYGSQRFYPSQLSSPHVASDVVGYGYGGGKAYNDNVNMKIANMNNEVDNYDFDSIDVDAMRQLTSGLSNEQLYSLAAEVLAEQQQQQQQPLAAVHYSQSSQSSPLQLDENRNRQQQLSAALAGNKQLNENNNNFYFLDVPKGTAKSQAVSIDGGDGGEDASASASAADSQELSFEHFKEPRHNKQAVAKQQTSPPPPLPQPSSTQTDSFNNLLEALKSYWTSSHSTTTTSKATEVDATPKQAPKTFVVVNNSRTSDGDNKWSFLKGAANGAPPAVVAQPTFKEESVPLSQNINDGDRDDDDDDAAANNNNNDDDNQRRAAAKTSLLGKYLFSPASLFQIESNSDVEDEQRPTQQSTVKIIQAPQVATSKRLAVHPSNFNSAKISDVKRSKLVDDLHRSNDLYFLVTVMGVCGLAATVVLAAAVFVYKTQVARKNEPEDDLPTYGVVGPNNLSVAIENSKHAAKEANAKLGGKDLAANLAFDNNNASPIKFGGNQVAAAAVVTSSGKKVDAICQKLGAGNNPFAPLGANNKTVFLSATNNAAMYHFQRQKQQMITNPNARGVNNNQNVSASDFDSDDDNDEDEENYTVYECPGLASAHNMEIKNPLFNDDTTPVNSSPPHARKK